MKRAIRKIAFVSPHCVLDFTNGAAMATLDGLSLLARSGFECQAFCGSRMDACEEVLVEEVLARRRVPYQVRNARIGQHQGRMIFTSHGQVPVTLFNSASTRGCWISPEEIAAFLSGCEIFLRRNRPDLLWTYGGDPVSMALDQLARHLGIPVLIALHNFAYLDPALFRTVDHVIVPSEFSRRHYRQSLGLDCQVLPYVIDPGRVLANRTNGPHPNPLPSCRVRPAVEGTMRPHPGPLPEGEGTKYVRLSSLTMQTGQAGKPNLQQSQAGKPDVRYVTFVNPQATKGLYVFARIAEVLARRRLEIPLLVIEGRNGPDWKQETGIDLGQLKNVTVRPNTTDPRTFYADTRLFIVPSLWNESFGLVAAEAMLNGIPVLASNRGALPETIGAAGLLFDIPARYTPETRELPTAEEVEPWVAAIIRLWDDAAEYERWRLAALERAKQWTPERLAPVYREFFGNLLAGTGDGEPYSSRSA